MKEKNGMASINLYITDCVSTEGAVDIYIYMARQIKTVSICVDQ
jgi:hypothetical protein